MSEKLKNAYNRLFTSEISLTRLRDAALTSQLYQDETGGFGIAGRSLAWKLFLSKHEPLQVLPSPQAASLLETIRVLRKDYANLLVEKLRAPDGSYETGVVMPGVVPTQPPGINITNNLEMNNPLSLHNENPWNEWFYSVELRKTISQDVERTFPEIPFFRESRVQAQLTNILFLYSVMHPSLGYRQGMHEVLAPLFYAVSFDSIPDDDNEGRNEYLYELCSETWVAADAWALFEAVMSGISQWYEWRETSTTPARQFALPLSNHVQLNLANDGNSIRAYVAPVVHACNRIQSELLRTTDPRLWNHMESAGIEPQIYGIRWLRLLFTREFSLPDAMRLWDGLFACDPTLELAQWVCVAMLIRIRNQLISTDYSGQLTLLLRYPSSNDNIAQGAPHHASLLLRQALALQMSPTPGAGHAIIVENHNVLNIPLEISPPQVDQSTRRRYPGRVTSSNDGRAEFDGIHSTRLSQVGIPEMIARGLLERGESLGINKTLMSAVSELRRNIPDLAANFIRSPNHSLSFPLEDESQREDRPPWEPRSRIDVERNLMELRSRDKRLGESLGWIVDVLLQDESNVDNIQRLQKQKREALESLSYVRDVLISNSSTLEEERLIGEEEALHRRHKLRHLPEGYRDKIGHEKLAKIVAPPAPLPVVDSQVSQPGTGRIKLRSPSPTSIMPVAQLSNQTEPKAAPWNYTKSNFSGSSGSIMSESLPRLPPPASATLKRDNIERASDGSGKYHDPLGAIR